MSFDISVAGIVISTELTALKSFPADLKLAFNLGPTFSSLLDTTLDKVPPSAASNHVSYTGQPASWQPAGGPVTFGLQGGASGAFDILTAGSLVDYTDGLESPQSKSITVPAGVAYTRLTLNFTISGNAAATYSGGPYGVNAELDADTTYKIVFCKAFPPATSLRDAISQTFQSYVLPFNKDTLTHMSPGDYLLHEFDGNLHLSFGAYVGLDKVFYAGQSSTDVLQALGSPVVTLSTAIAPEINASVNLGFCFQYENKFEALLSRQTATGHLHLFRAQTTDIATTLTAGLSFDAGMSASITSNLPTIQDSIKSAVAGTSATASNILDSVLTKANKEINKYVTEVNSKLTSWLNRGNGIQTNLQAAIETNQDRTLLVGYTFDLAAPQYPAAWTAAIDGDFVKAFNSGAVTLDIDSGLEKSYQAKTSFSANFFNLWHWKTWSDFATNASLVYAGNNIFHLVAKVGRDTETDAVGAMRSINFYFALAANVAANGTASAADLSLHVDLTSKGDKGASSRIAKLLGALNGGAGCDALAKNLSAFAATSKTGAVELHITIPQASFAKINCDSYANGKPATSNPQNDSANWSAFAKAADDLDAWPLPDTLSGANAAYLESFQAWKTLNTYPGNPINRLNTDYPIGTWPDTFPSGIDTGRQALIIHSLTAGQNFMNFCADLKSLAQATSPAAVPQPWEDLLQQVTNAIKRDADIDFARPATLALIRLCGTGAIAVEGPVPPALPVDLFAVKLTLQRPAP
jgi:hypothetical protein